MVLDSLIVEADAELAELEGVDVKSEASTVGTQFTRYTAQNTEFTITTNRSKRSHRSRRREERKKLSGKKGSVYEKTYLLDSMKRMSQRLVDAQSNAYATSSSLFLDEMEDMCWALVTVHRLERAKELRNMYLSAMECVLTQVPEELRPLHIMRETCISSALKLL